MHWWVVALRLTGIGWYVVASILGGTLLGVFVDGKFGTGVTFTTIGVLFGSIVAFFNTMPKLRHTIEVTNPKTEVKSEVVLEGLESFLE